MAKFRPSRLLKPDILRSIEHTCLCDLLRKFEGDLSARGLTIPAPDSEDELDYDALIELLKQPDIGELHDLCEAFYFIDETATPAMYDKLLIRAVRRGNIQGWSSELTPADLATRVWLQDRTMIEQLHAERAVHRRRNFRVFGVEDAERFDPDHTDEFDAERFIAMLSPYFVQHGRSAATRIFLVKEKDTHWYMIRYGSVHVRAGCVEHGQSGSVFFQPEEYDVIGYCPSMHEIRINSGLNKPGEAYLPPFGELLYGDAEAFSHQIEYALEPLRILGEGALIPPHGRGIDRIVLTEVHIMIGGKYQRRNMIRATDVFAALKESHQKLPPRAPISEAKFKVHFTGHKSPRSVKVCAGGNTTYSRDEDSEAVERWLTERGFKRSYSGPLDDSSFWSALPDCLDLEVSEVEWRWRLGGHLDWCRQFLVPCEGLAVGFSDKRGGTWTVHQRDQDDWIAIEESGAGEMDVDRDVLRIFRFDVATFGVGIISAMKLRAAPERPFPGKNVLMLGLHRPFEGVEVPVWFVFEHDSQSAADAVNAINANSSERSIILVPIRELIDQATDTAIEVAGQHWIALEHAFRIQRDAALTGTGRFADLLTQVRQAFIKSPDPEKGIMFFPTPVGTKWPEVSITIIDPVTAIIRVRDVKKTVTYAQMGMSDNRESKPDKKWELLRILAAERSQLEGKRGPVSVDVRATRSRLSTALVDFFGIRDRPFEWGGAVPTPKFQLASTETAAFHTAEL